MKASKIGDYGTSIVALSCYDTLLQRFGAIVRGLFFKKTYVVVLITAVDPLGDCDCTACVVLHAKYGWMRERS